jgi:hypothetical protein
MVTEVEDVREVESDRHAALLRFAARLPDGLQRSVDADDVETHRRDLDRVFAAAAAPVDDAPGDQACLKQAHKLGLSSELLGTTCS